MVQWLSSSDLLTDLPVPTSSQEPRFAESWPSEPFVRMDVWLLPIAAGQAGPTFDVDLTGRTEAAEAVLRVQETLEGPPLRVTSERLREAEGASV